MSQYDSSLQTPESKGSAWGAIFRIITEPEATFRSFGEHLPILPGYLVQMGLSLVMALLMLPATLAMVEQQLATMPQASPINPGVMKMIQAGSVLFSALITPWLAGVFTALLALFIGQFQGGARNFTQYMGLVGYSRLTLALGSVVQGLIIFLTGKIQMSNAISLAAFAPEGASPYLTGFLGAFNPFSFWYWAVMAIGFGVLHKGTWKKGISLVVIMFILSVLIATVGNGLTHTAVPGVQ
ncbi:MAG TPA: YIP1 family protein [Symbiobacteriaceae bacterium]|jgi:hypothetical protein|nr:YIP1 family protein [Symbiobacteriaceae bacterium]